MGTGHRKVSFNRSKEIDVGILNSCSLLAGFTYRLPCFSWSPPWILSEGLQFHILLIDGCTTQLFTLTRRQAFLFLTGRGLELTWIHSI